MAKKKIKKQKKLKVFKKKPKKAGKVLIKKKRVVKKSKSVFKKPKKKNRIQRKASKKSKANPSTRLRAGKPAPKNSTVENFSAKSFFKAKIKVIGIGGGGSSIVSEIGRSLHKASFVVADTDVRAFKKRSGIKYFLFGQDQTHGLGTGLDVALAKRAAEQDKEKISKLFADQDIVIFVASLGGGLGSGATQVFAEATKDFNGISLGIFTLPFKFEGAVRQRLALKALRELRDLLNVSITIPNEKIFKVIDASTSITDAFSIVNKSLIESLESLIDLIYSPGIINIDFADLRAILSGRGSLAFLNAKEASGKDRADTIIHEILHNPLYQNNNFTAEKILFNIASSGNLSMLEVDKISRAISEQSPKAKIIFGISRDSQLKNKIKTTLLMTGPALYAKPDIKKEEPPIKLLQEKKLKRAVLDIKAKKVSLKKTKVRSVSGKTLDSKKSAANNNLPIEHILPPVFENAEADVVGARKLSVVETNNDKKAIRRSAMEIKKDREREENEKSQQEKEWEIPAFLRKIKFKP